MRRALSKFGGRLVWPHNRVLGVVKVVTDDKASLISALSCCSKRKTGTWEGQKQKMCVRNSAVVPPVRGVRARGGLLEGIDEGLQPLRAPP